MKTQAILNKIEELKRTLEAAGIGVKFDSKLAPKREQTFKHWFREEVPSDGLSRKSGIYIFSDENDEILYIGKAASNNLGSEIYSKFSAATDFNSEGFPLFKKNNIAKYSPLDKPELAQSFISGDILITVVEIEKKECTSLVEVFLQTFCALSEGLPPLNKQIG